MLIYMILMVAVSVFLYKESIHLLKEEPYLLQDLAHDPLSRKIILVQMRRVLLAALFSGGLMLACFVVTKTTGVMPKPLAAISIAVYAIGLIAALLKLKDLS